MLDATTWRLVSPLLDRALDLGHDARADLLAELRTDRPDVAALVADLLAEHDRLVEARFLERGPSAPDTAADSIG